MASDRNTNASNAANATWIALLGRKDIPADGITDYCEQLAKSAAKHGIEVRLVRVEWATQGWLPALRTLWRQSKSWRGVWVLPQYAAMGWSKRGFPLGALVTAAILRLRGARCAMLFHEPWGVGGPRLIDRIRGAFQNWVVRTLHRFSEKSIFTIPLSSVPWLAAHDAKSAFIPLGPNIPENLTPRSPSPAQNGVAKNVVVFCVSESPYGEREINDIAAASRAVIERGLKLRLTFVGRGTAEAKNAIDNAFAGTEIEVCNRGLCEAQEVTRIFSESDAMIAVRGRLYLRRGSALAGLACGLPIVAYSGAAEEAIIRETGISLVRFRDHAALGSALLEILTNSGLWREMHQKNIRFQQKYLSWNVIANSFSAFLGPSRE
ncbi:MAG TPA: glycosyltransferase [Candidatus Acidoferrales bacterium]